MKITLPIRGHYKVDGMPSRRYSITYNIDSLDIFYMGNVTYNELNFSSCPITANFALNPVVCPLSACYSINAVNGSLKTLSDVTPAGISFSLSASPVLIRGAEIDDFSVGFSVTEVFAALMKLTTLNDFDGALLSKMDHRSLNDLAYVVIEQEV